MVLLCTACSAEKTMTTDWFILHVPNGITFTETSFGYIVPETETTEVRYKITDNSKGIISWFIKSVPEDTKEWYSTFRVVMSQLKLELAEKKETDTYRIYVYTPIMVTGEPLADQYEIYGLYQDDDASWFVKTVAPYAEIDFKDGLVQMFDTIEFIRN